MSSASPWLQSRGVEKEPSRHYLIIDDTRSDNAQTQKRSDYTRERVSMRFPLSTEKRFLKSLLGKSAIDTFPSREGLKQGGNAPNAKITETKLAEQNTVSKDKPMSELDHKLVDAKIEKANAEIRKDMSDLRGDMNTELARINGTLEKMASDVHDIKGVKGTVILTAISSVLAIAAVLIALLQYGQAQFGIGGSVNDRIDEKLLPLSEKLSEAEKKRMKDQKVTQDLLRQLLEKQQQSQ